jgi:hypothetical protein
MTVREMVLKGRFCTGGEVHGDALEVQLATFKLTQNALNKGLAKLIRVQSVYDDLAPSTGLTSEDWERALNYHAVPRPLPPFQCCWLEARGRSGPKQSIGVIATRWLVEQLGRTPLLDALPKEVHERMRNQGAHWVVNAVTFADYRGNAFNPSNLLYWLDADGQFLSHTRILFGAPAEPQIQSDRFLTGLMLASFGRLNCRNVELVVDPSCLPKQKQKHCHRRAQTNPTIWHDIRISSVPKLPARSANSGGGADDVERRFHWVRGHFADYSKGNGLFGNPNLRCTFWMPEHHRGSADAGEVFSSYTIDKV